MKFPLLQGYRSKPNAERRNGPLQVTVWWTDGEEKSNQAAGWLEGLIGRGEIYIVEYGIGAPDIANGAEVRDGKAI
jgi:hypothetical protein